MVLHSSPMSVIKYSGHPSKQKQLKGLQVRGCGSSACLGTVSYEWSGACFLNLFLFLI